MTLDAKVLEDFRERQGQGNRRRRRRQSARPSRTGANDGARAAGGTFPGRHVPGNRHAHPQHPSGRRQTAEKPARRWCDRRNRLCRPHRCDRLQSGFQRGCRHAWQDACRENGPCHAERGTHRHADCCIQRFRRSPHSGGGGCSVGLWSGVLPKRSAVRGSAADRGHLRAMRRRCGLFAGVDGLHHHDEDQCPHVHYRLWSSRR
jgi:hypothetical protein